MANSCVNYGLNSENVNLFPLASLGRCLFKCFVAQEIRLIFDFDDLFLVDLSPKWVA
jgi:hypothetical protein